MKRIDYVKAAIMNDRGMYDEAKGEAFSWLATGPGYQEQAAADFAALHGEEVAACFPWLFPASDELKAGYIQAVNDIAAEEVPTIMTVRSGSAVYWDPAECRYYVVERSMFAGDFLGGLDLVGAADTLRDAMDMCDGRAGVCRPAESYPETLREL